ncbi:MAG: sulfatase [Polyangiales bacterium]
MPSKSLSSAVALWAAAYLGCGLLLVLSMLPPPTISLALLGQLSWLALIGSIPTALLLGAAERAAEAPRPVILASSLAVCIFVAAIGWEHADFLLSGPHWLFHPRRGVMRAALVAMMCAVGVGGWLWLILGTRCKRGTQVAAWLVLSATAVGASSAAMIRYRAFDYSTAQLVFPAGSLCGSIVRRLARKDSFWSFVLLTAAAGAIVGIGTRFDPQLVQAGQRELIAHNRAGTLATLYVLPHLGREGTWSAIGTDCPEPRPVVQQSPIGIEPNGRRNVVIISVDALRNDVVGIEVNRRPVTPKLSRFSRIGVSFDNATSPYPATLFAIGSAFTGLTPAELYLSPRLPETIFTWSRTRVDEQLAILPDVSWFHLPIVARFLTPGVKTAFAPTDRTATDALVAGLREARNRGSSVMAWIHYYSPHDPYEAQPEFPFGRGKKNAYLSEVATFDRELGRLMRYLTDEGWLDDTLVVFFSDHGEALGEQSYWGHHVYLDSWMVDVPLVLWHARLTPSRPRVGVSLSDIAPTILHFLGLPLPSDIVAQSLFTLDPQSTSRPSFSEAFPIRGQELFDSFALLAFDDVSIQARLRSIRVASKGYEPKAAIRSNGARLIRHRSTNTTLFYGSQIESDERPGGGVPDQEVAEQLRSELESWEEAQLQRIRCRLQLTGDQIGRPRPE